MAPKPRIDAILTMEPPVPLAIMRRAASRPTRNTPSRFTAITSRHSSSLVLTKKEPDGTPALLMRTVMGPATACAASNARPTEAWSVTSSSTAQALPPAERISASSWRRRSSRRAASATAAPAPASTRAKCAPNPDEAPVTRAVLPVREGIPFDEGPRSSVQCVRPRGLTPPDSILHLLELEPGQIVRVGGEVAQADAPLDRHASAGRMRGHEQHRLAAGDRGAM